MADEAERQERAEDERRLAGSGNAGTLTENSFDASARTADDQAGVPPRTLGRARWLTFPSHDELVGYWPLANRRGLLAVARRRDNLFARAFRETEPRPSPPDQ
jgi:hypothetical protein